MIWIVTLCLLATFAWFLFNAINEKRWVDAHSHDEAVARDQGFLPSFSSVKSAVSSDADGKVSLSQENTRLARAVAKVQEKTAKASGYIERKAAEGRGDGTRPASVRDEDSFFGRTAAKVAGASDAIGSKLDERMRKASERTSRSDEPGADDGVFGRAVAKVAGANRSLEERAAERAKRNAERTRERERAPGDGAAKGGAGFFDRMVDKVGTQSARLDAKLDARAERARESGEASGPGLARDDDFLSRASARIGARINEADERIVEKSRDLVNRDKKGG